MEKEPMIMTPENSNQPESQGLLPEKTELSEKSNEELKNASGFMENFITSFSDSNIKSAEHAMGPDVLGNGVKHEAAVNLTKAMLPEVTKGLIHGLFDLNETISQETKSAAKERIDSYMAEIKETGQDPYEVMAESGNFTKALNGEHYLTEPEEKQPNDNGAILEVVPESIDMSKQQPESVENELETKFEGLWEAGDKVGAIGVAMGRRVDSQEIMNDKMLGLALLSSNPKEAYGVLLVHRAFCSNESEKA